MRFAPLLLLLLAGTFSLGKVPKLQRVFEVGESGVEAVDDVCTSSYLEVLHWAEESLHAFGTLPEGVGFYELPLHFDVARLQLEAAALVAEHQWTLRPDIQNYFVLLVTQNGHPTDQSHLGPFGPVGTRLDSSPYMRQALDSLGAIIGRSRLMMLPTGQNLKRHVDLAQHLQRDSQDRLVPDVQSGYWARRYRVHIPIVTDPSVTFHADEGADEVQLHMEAGRAYLFDNTLLHEVRNPSTIDRVHLVADVSGSKSFFDLIRRSEMITARGRLPAGGLLPLQATNPNFALAGHLRSTGAAPSTTITYDSAHNALLLFENWTDAPVFRPMRARDVSTFLQDYAAPLVCCDDTTLAQAAHDLLTSFPTEWTRASEIQSDPEALLQMISRLVRQAARLHCQGVAQGTPIYLQSTATSARASLSLANVVDNFARHLFFICKLGDMGTGPQCFPGEWRAHTRQRSTNV